MKTYKIYNFEVAAEDFQGTWIEAWDYADQVSMTLPKLNMMRYIYEFEKYGILNITKNKSFTRYWIDGLSSGMNSRMCLTFDSFGNSKTEYFDYNSFTFRVRLIRYLKLK